MRLKRHLSLVLALIISCNISVMGFATEDTSNKIYSKDTGITEGISEITLEIVKSEDILIATVPLQIPVVTDTRGNATYPDNLVIKNETEDKNIEVTYIDYDFSQSNIYVNSHTVVDWKDLGHNLIEHTGENERVIAIDVFDIAIGMDEQTWEGRDISSLRGEYGLEPVIIPAGEEYNLGLNVGVSESIYINTISEQVIGTIAFTLAIVE